MLFSVRLMRSATITDAVEPLERPDRLERGGLPEAEAKAGAGESCFHCGTRCAGGSPSLGEKVFCCQGCLCVFEILSENGLTDFYKLSATAGVRVTATAQEEQFRYLDEPSVRERLVNFSNEKLTRVTFRVPSIHCIACVWLLENLFRLNPGIGEAQVNFPRKEVVISFASGK